MAAERQCKWAASAGSGSERACGRKFASQSTKCRTIGAASYSSDSARKSSTEQPCGKHAPQVWLTACRALPRR